jgi:addiction module HigA family antidote
MKRIDMTERKLMPVRPGELLNEEFLIPMGIAKNELARDISVPTRFINEILTGRRTVTADIDLRLCKYLNLSPGYWLRLQNLYDTEVTRTRIEPILAKIKPYENLAIGNHQVPAYA